MLCSGRADVMQFRGGREAARVAIATLLILSFWSRTMNKCMGKTERELQTKKATNNRKKSMLAVGLEQDNE